MPEIRKEKPYTAWLVALFFIALTALGLFTGADYGQPWDEPWEQDILRMNRNQYAAAFGSGERLALASDMPGPASGLIADSIEKDHGECAYYPVFNLVSDASLSPIRRMTLWHAYTWLWFVAGAAALWLVCRRLGLSRFWSCVATLFFVLTPRMFAEGHYNNKDMVLLSLVLLTLWLALRLMEHPNGMRAALFSLAGAAATNTKIVGLFVWGLCALFVLVRQVAGRRMTGRVWLAAFTALIAYAGFYTLLTPALWGDPVGYLRYVIGNATGFTRWENEILFRGTVFSLKYDLLPRYYLPYMILVTTPLWLLALIGVGQVFAVGRIARLRSKLLSDETGMALLLCTLLWLLPLAYAVIARPTVYNGWRHFYFLYGPMLALAAYGLHRIREKLKSLRMPHPKRIGAGLLILLMAWTGGLEAVNHPNQYTYYNELVGNRYIPDYLELDYWNVSVLQTLRALLKQTAADGRITVAGADLWSQIGLETNWKLLDPADQARMEILSQESAASEYLLANRTYSVLADWQAGNSLQPVTQTESFGLPLCTVYHRTSGPGSECVELSFVETAGASGKKTSAGEAVATVGREAGV